MDVKGLKEMLESKGFEVEGISNEIPGVEVNIIIPKLEEVSAAQLDSVFRKLAVIPCQTHSVDVALVDDKTMDYKADALVTFKDDVRIGVRTADCVPVLVYAPDVRGVAAIHAGWRGTIGGIVDNTLEILRYHGANPKEMKIFFGPSISREVYEVDTELARRFIDAGFEKFVSWPYGDEIKPHIDLQGVNIERLNRRGVLIENITPHHGCTFKSCSPTERYLYPSYRRCNGTPYRLLSTISLTI